MYIFLALAFLRCLLTRNAVCVCVCVCVFVKIKVKSTRSILLQKQLGRRIEIMIV